MLPFHDADVARSLLRLDQLQQQVLQLQQLKVLVGHRYNHYQGLNLGYHHRQDNSRVEDNNSSNNHHQDNSHQVDRETNHRASWTQNREGRRSRAKCSRSCSISG